LSGTSFNPNLSSLMYNIVMVDDIGVEGNNEVGVYPYQIKTRKVGKVSDDLVAEVVDTMKDVFIRLGYQDEPPEIVSISQGAVILPSGEEIEACYGYDQPGVPGRIYVSTEGSKKSFGKSKIPVHVAAAAFAAHEAVEHVNNMRGKTLLSSHKKIKPEDHTSDTEVEANRIAREIVGIRYGWTVKFGDENL